jgi:hypothetical protein
MALVSRQEFFDVTTGLPLDQRFLIHCELRQLDALHPATWLVLPEVIGVDRHTPFLVLAAIGPMGRYDLFAQLSSLTSAFGMNEELFRKAVINAFFHLDVEFSELLANIADQVDLGQMSSAAVSISEAHRLAMKPELEIRTHKLDGTYASSYF